MQQWEYKSITLSTGAVRATSVDKEYEKELNEYGADGWELVSVVVFGAGAGARMRAIFKRSKQG